jgi:hypothetical protein
MCSACVDDEKHAHLEAQRAFDLEYAVLADGHYYMLAVMLIGCGVAFVYWLIGGM